MDSILDHLHIERAFSPLFSGQTLHIQQVLAGNINTIVKVEVDGRSYGLRIRTHERVYRYEPDLIKEAFVLWLMRNAANSPRDREAASAFAQLKAAAGNRACTQGCVARRTLLRLVTTAAATSVLYL